MSEHLLSGTKDTTRQEMWSDGHLEKGILPGQPPFRVVEFNRALEVDLASAVYPSI